MKEKEISSSFLSSCSYPLKLLEQRKNHNKEEELELLLLLNI